MEALLAFFLRQRRALLAILYQNSAVFQPARGRGVENSAAI